MLTLICKAYKDGASVPERSIHTSVGGKNISPGFQWNDAPAGTKTFCFSIVDPHPVARNWVHWLVVNIPGATTELPEGASRRAMPAGTVELVNGYGESGYGGPAPPKGTGPHPYIATIYALSTSVDASTISTLKQFQQALEGKILAHASLTGFFERR